MNNYRKFYIKKIEQISHKVELDLTYFISGGFWNIAGTLISILGGILLSSLFSHLWHADVYGQYIFVLSAVTFLSVTALPGMATALTQAVAEGDIGFLSEAIKKVTIWSLLGTSILIAGGLYFIFRDNYNLGLTVLLISLSFPLNTAGVLYISYLNGLKQFKTVAILTSLTQGISILLTGLSLISYSNFIVVTVVSFWSTAILNLFISYYYFNKTNQLPTSKSRQKLATHLSISQFFTIGADYLDRFLIPILLGFSSNAIYAFAILVPNQIHNLFKIFTILAQPKISSLSSKNILSSVFKKSLQLEIIIITIVLSYILVAPLIFKILFPLYINSAVSLSQVFCLSMLYFPSNLYGLSLIKMNKIKYIHLTNFIYFLCSAITLLLFIPLFGIWGAIFSKLITRVVYALIQGYLLFSSFRNKR